MEDETLKEDIRLRVRGLLSIAQIKLWLPPYTGEDSSSYLESLAEIYSIELKLDKGDILIILKELQSHSLERATANERFKETGVATLRLAFTSVLKDMKNSNIDITLDSTGQQLIKMIIEKLPSEPGHLKLIHKGRVIKHNTGLSDQGIKNGDQILVIVLIDNPDNLRKNSDMYMALQLATADAEMLAGNFIGETFMQLEDQSGNQLKLPSKEKKALMIAMALHEKGRASMRDKNCSLALIFLLEADKHFSDCTAQILKTVDNYALLNLDIAWCYLCLKSITHIPDAEKRLKVCEKRFHTSYGENLERLIALKGSSGNEKALFMRLHLLQGIIHYHQNQRDEARYSLTRAQEELKALKLNEMSLCTLVEKGYTLTEARMGLRSSEGSVQGAINFISKSRKLKDEKLKKAKEDWEGTNLGVCDDNNQFVSVKCLQALQSMGYDRDLAIIALKRCNNVICNAIQIIQDQGEILLEKEVEKRSKKYPLPPPPLEMIEQLVHMGYDPVMCVKALVKCKNMMNSAANLLIMNGGFVEDDEDDSPDGTPSSSRNSLVGGVKKKIKMMADAYSRLCEGLENFEESYLDLSLEQEEEYLKQYINLLQ